MRKKKVKKEEASETCPNGHKLPKRGCSPLACKDEVTQLGAVSGDSDENDVTEDAIAAAEAKAARFLETRAKVRQSLVPVAKVDHDQMDEWVESKKAELLPAAVAEIEYQLKFSSSDKARIEAARDILDMSGLRKREAPMGIAPTIIFNPGPGFVIPWKQQPVIEGKAEVKPLTQGAQAQESAVADVTEGSKK